MKGVTWERSTFIHSIAEKIPSRISKKIVKKIVPPDTPSFERIVKLMTVFYPPTLSLVAVTLLIVFGA